MALRLHDLVVVEAVGALPRFVARRDAIPADAEVIRFDDSGQAVAGAGRVTRLAFAVPRLAGMTELVVDRARARLSGRPVDTAPVPASKSSGGATLVLAGGPGGLHQVDLEGLTVAAPAGQDLVLTADRGEPSRYRWHAGAEGVERHVTGGGHQLHLMVRAHDGDGFGPPVAAAPHYDMPGDAARLYGPVLAGATVTLDDPVTGSARLTFDPPVAATRVQLFLGSNGDTGVHAGLPHGATPVSWTATAVRATWASAPTGVRLTAGAGGEEQVMVAELPGALGPTPVDVDLTPAARALLGAAYARPGGTDLALAVDARSDTAGDLVASSLELTAHYRLHSVGPEGLAVVLRGSPATVPLPVAPGLRPAQLVLTVDGRFGRGVRVAASDLDRPGRRTGLRLAGAAQASRRLPLTTLERSLPLLRVSLHGRADEPTELVLTLAADRDGRRGAALGPPLALRVVPSSEPAWHRLDLPVPTDPPASPAVWLTAAVTTGRFWWYAEPDPPDGRLGTASADGGATWSSVADHPVAQLHFLADRPEPAPLTLHGLGRVLSGDLLQAPASRSRIETTRLDAARRGLPVTELDTVPSTVSFRKEAVAPLPDLALVAGAGPSLPLTFACDRDVDLRVLDAVLRYDPWAARP